VVGAISYRLQVDNNPTFSSPEVDVANITATSYTTAGLAVGTWYAHVRVDTSDAGECDPPSAWSESKWQTITVCGNTGTVYARGVLVDADVRSCDIIKNNPTSRYFAPVTFTLDSDYMTPQVRTQGDSDYVSWSGDEIVTGVTYTLDADAPAG